MVAFAVTGTYAGTNACFNTCGEKPDCAGRVSSTIQLNPFFRLMLMKSVVQELFPQDNGCWSCCTKYGTAS